MVLLPQPDSPTIENVSPRRTSKSTPSTACTALVDLLQEAALDREVLDQPLDLEQALARRSGVATSGGVAGLGVGHCSLGVISCAQISLALGGRDVAGDEVARCRCRAGRAARVRHGEPTRSW